MTEFEAVREALNNHVEFNDELDHEMATRLLAVLDALAKGPITHPSSCSPASPVVAQAVPWKFVRAQRCPHGVSHLNRCLKCD